MPSDIGVASHALSELPSKPFGSANYTWDSNSPTPSSLPRPVNSLRSTKLLIDCATVKSRNPALPRGRAPTRDFEALAGSGQTATQDGLLRLLKELMDQKHNPLSHLRISDDRHGSLPLRLSFGTAAAPPAHLPPLPSPRHALASTISLIANLSSRSTRLNSMPLKES